MSVTFLILFCFFGNMNTEGRNARRTQDGNDNKEVAPHVPQGPQAPNDEEAMSNMEIRSALQTLT